MKKNYLKIFLSLVVFLGCVSFQACIFFNNNSSNETKQVEDKKGDSSEYDDLQLKVSKLKKEDPWGKQEESRVRLANKLYSFYTRYPESKEGISCLYDAVTILEESYKNNKDNQIIYQILYFTGGLHRTHPKNDLADDIILKEGDIYHFILHDENKAKESYRIVLEYYNDAESVAIAKERLGDESIINAGNNENTPTNGKQDIGDIASENQLEATATPEALGTPIATETLLVSDTPVISGTPIATETLPAPETPAILGTPIATETNSIEAVKEDKKEEIINKISDNLNGDRQVVATPANSDSKQKDFVVVIDPGHGGAEYGAKHPQGLLEKDVVLDIALRLEKVLMKNTNFQVFLTRREDKFMSLSQRTEFANKMNADIFISIHNNASVERTAYGIETYYLDNTDDKSSRKLAERENKSLEFEGAKTDDLKFMLSDLIQNGKQEESIVLANTIQSDVISQLEKRKWRGIKNLGVKKAPFYVLVGAHMPCVLVETMFIDNIQDYRKLMRPEFRDDLAYSLYSSLYKFYSEKKK